MKRSNFHFVRQINEISVLRIIRDEGPISRSDVAREMGVSKVIIGGIVKRLLETNILFEIGKGQSTTQGGRRPVMLEFNADAGLAIGVEVHLHQANILITNMNAEILHERTVKFQDNSVPEDILLRIVKAIQKLVGDAEKMRSILGVGLALPGLIDYEDGSILTSHSLKSWEGFPIKKYFEEVEVKYFHLLSLAAVPFRKTKIFHRLRYILDKMDKYLLSSQLIGKYGWIMVIVIKTPKKI